MVQIMIDTELSSENLRRKPVTRNSILPLRLKRLRHFLREILSRFRGVVEVAPANTQARQPTSAEVYVRSMTSNLGLALWEPRPLHVGEQGAVPGDVGTFSSGGEFRKIFNLWADAEAVRGANLTPHSFDPPEKKIITREAALLPITYGTTTETQYTNGRISSFEFKMVAPRGAVCVPTSPADLVELENRVSLGKFVVENARLIYQYAKMVQEMDDESLYIVTSCIKSDSWAVAAFKEPSCPPHDVLRLVELGDPGPIPAYVWTSRGTASARCGSNPTRNTQDYKGKNQTLFIHAYELTSSATFQSRNESKERETRSCLPKMWSHISPKAPYIQYFPRERTLDPFHAANRKLLHLTNADFALTHHEDWRLASEGDLSDQPELSSVLRTSSVSVCDGVAFLLPKTPSAEVGDMD